MKFSRALALWTTVGVTAVMPAVGWAGFLLSRAFLKDAIQEFQMQVARHTMDAIDRLLYQSLKEFEALSQTDELAEALAAAEPPADPAAVPPGPAPAQRAQAVLDAMARSSVRWDLLKVVDAHGRVLASTRAGPSALTLTAQDREALTQALVQSRHVSDVVRSAETGRPTMVVASAVQAGAPADRYAAGGAVLGQLAWPLVLELLDGLDAHDRVRLVNSQGRVIAAPTRERSRILEEDVLALPLVRRTLLSGAPSADLYPSTSPGAGRVLGVMVAQLGYLDHPGHGWGLLIERPSALVFAPVRKLGRVFSVLVLGALAVLIMLLSGIGAELTKPIERLTYTARLIAAGKLDTRAAPSRVHEVGLLANAFNRMIDSLTAEIAERKRLEWRLAAQYSVSRVLAEAAEDAIPQVLQAACTALDWPWGEFWVVDRGANLLRCAEVWHRDGLAEAAAAARQATCPLDAGFPGRVVSAGEPVWIQDLTKEAEDAPRPLPAAYHAALGVPVSLGREVVGVLAFLHEQQPKPDDDLLATVAAISGQLGQYLLRKQGEEARQRLAAIVDSSADAIIGETLGGRITSWNRGAERLYGYAAEEILGLSATRLVPRDRSEEHAKLLQRLKRGEPVEDVETVRLRKDGSPVDVSLTLSPIRDATGWLIGTSAIARDIAERKQAQLRLEEAMRLRAEFISMVSHELRTPLGIIQEGLDLVLDGSAGALNPEQREYLDTAKRNVDRLRRLITDVLDYQKLEAGRMEVALSEEDLNALAADVAHEFEPVAEKKGLRIVTRLAPGLPKVSCDRDKIIQVLTNFLNNAVKFAEQGTITVSTKRDADWIRLAVTDEGEGISLEGQAKLFQPFSRIAAPAGRRKPGGTGLGLAIAKRIITLHKGYIGVESAPGKGATFYFTMKGMPP